MSPNTDFWIMRPFNLLFCIVSLVFIVILVIATLLVRNKSEKTRKIVLVSACIVTLIGFFVYKAYLSADKEYNVITQLMGGFNWWGELPLQLCNINMILIPIAVLTGKRSLESFCFLIGPLGAFFALILPSNGFEGYSLLLPRMLGFYGTHFMIIIEALAIGTFGFYRPKFKDLPKTALTIFCLAAVIHCVNLLLRVTGLHPKANYFFSVETEGNALLEIFHRLIPIPFLYLLPSILILGAYSAVIISGFEIADRIAKKK